METKNENIFEKSITKKDFHLNSIRGLREENLLDHIFNNLKLTDSRET